MKLIVTRGEALTRGYAVLGQRSARRASLLRYPWPPGSQAPARRRAWRLPMRLGENPALAGLKHLNRLEQVLAQAERPRGS